MVVYLVVLSQVLVGLIVNNQGYLGLFPIVVSSIYYFLITKIDSNGGVKLLLVTNLALWVIYYIVIKDYIGALTDSFSIAPTLAVVGIQVRGGSNKNKENK